MVLVGSYLKEVYLKALGYLEAHFLQPLGDLGGEYGPAVFCGADQVVDEDGDVMALVDESAHAFILSRSRAAGN